jgi:hypothetical protein
VFLTRPPLAGIPKDPLPLDLHVLGLPPAFNLSHDQTLQLRSFLGAFAPNHAQQNHNHSMNDSIVLISF